MRFRKLCFRGGQCNVLICKVLSSLLNVLSPLLNFRVTGILRLGQALRRQDGLGVGILRLRSRACCPEGRR